MWFCAGSNQHGSIQGHTTVTSGSLLDDDHWHSVVIERYRRNVNFTLDHHAQHFRTNGQFDHLDLDYEVQTLLGDLLPLGQQGAKLVGSHWVLPCVGAVA